MSNGISVDGVKDVVGAFNRFKNTATNNVEKALVTGALRVERDAKTKAPVDSGRLRSSLTNVTENFGTNSPAVKVGTNVEYAAAQEFGTSRFPAQPFLYPALTENKKKILSDIAAAIRRGAGL